MLNYKIYRKWLPEYIRKQLPELFVSISDGTLFGLYDNNGKNAYHSVIYVFKEPHAERRKIVGAVCVTIGEPTCFDQLGRPFFNVYIERFEVNKRYHRKGYGKEMFNVVENIYNPITDRFSLMHMSYDDKRSYKFWRSNGFRHVHSDNYMEKIIRK